jgi:hypothetical protein
MAPPPEQAQPSQPRRRGPNKAKDTAPAPTTAPFMAPAQAPTGTGYNPQQFQPVGTMTTPTPPMQMPPVPDFLQRAPGPRQDGPAPDPSTRAQERFGMSNPPAPPPGVQDALNAAMSLPTRR